MQINFNVMELENILENDDCVFEYQSSVKKFVNNRWIVESKGNMKIFKVEEHRYIMALKQGLLPETILILQSESRRNQVGVPLTATMQNGLIKYFIGVNIDGNAIVVENYQFKFKVSFVI